MNNKRNVGILLFRDVEVLDFAGPFEVFSVTGQRDGEGLFNVYTVAKEREPVLARNGLSINARYDFTDCPKTDILVIPGGYGTRPLLDCIATIGWIKQRSEQCELVLSVCSGALLLAKAGLLDGLRATTHHSAQEELRLVAPKTCVVGTERIVDNGRVILSAGVAAGIDMALHVVTRLLGDEVANETANYIEYSRDPSGIVSPPPSMNKH